jgi:phosphoglycolate phosphatase-like HAD superfamily hydrolase
VPKSAIVFDCDGVLLDSNKMKNDAFASALSDFPAKPVDAFLEYQPKNFGRSRYRLIDDFFEMFLQRAAAAGEKEAILGKFGDYCSEAYRKVPMTEGAQEVLDTFAGQHTMIVASGSAQQELRDVFRDRGLDRYFTGIFGSPARKADILCDIAKDTGILCMVGDARADYEAAQAAGANFVFVSRYSMVADEMGRLAEEAAFPAIETLVSLPHIVQSFGADLCQP